MNQQRSRRFRAAQEAEEKRAEEKKVREEAAANGHTVLPPHPSPPSLPTHPSPTLLFLSSPLPSSHSYAFFSSQKRSQGMDSIRIASLQGRSSCTKLHARLLSMLWNDWPVILDSETLRYFPSYSLLYYCILCYLFIYIIVIMLYIHFLHDTYYDHNYILVPSSIFILFFFHHIYSPPLLSSPLLSCPLFSSLLSS